MRKLMMLSALVLSLGSLSACGKKGIDGALDKMEDFKNKVCACKDMDCAKKTSADMDTYMKGLEKDMKDTKPSKAQDERADKIGDDMAACMKKLEPAAPPAATP